MKNDSFTTPEILDVTEVEKCKIQQEAETKRRQLEESEKTKRAKIESRTQIWRNEGVQLVVGICGVGLLIVGGTIGGCYVHRRFPEPPDSTCRETAKVIEQGSFDMQCGGGAHLETENIPGTSKINAKCVCTHPRSFGDAK